jgi:SAM-dependent methyltransferase
MRVHTGNPYVRKLKRLFRRKVKLMPPEEAERWRDELATLYREEYGLALHPLQSDPAMVPPVSVIDQVQGPSKADPTTFLGTGAREAFGYLSELSEFGVKMTDVKRMLDFGFGTGRILLHFLPFDLERHGCDVNQASCDWTTKTLGAYADLRMSRLEPPLDYPDDYFDLIIATSVFTHTPFDLQPRWIAEFARILRSGGTSIVTVHDPDKMPEQGRDQGWLETGNRRGIHMRTFLTEEKLAELWGTPLEYLGLRRHPGTQAHVIARKP